MPHDPEAFAEMVVLTVKASLAPILERLAAAEARLAALPVAEKSLTDLRDRMVTIETKAATPIPPDAAFYELRERVLAVETKAAPVLDVPADVLSRISALENRPQTPPVVAPDVDLSPVLERVSRLEMDVTKDFGVVRERLAVVETRAQVPGPAGKDGVDGKDGAPGKDGEAGRDGLAGLSFEGVYQDGQTYEKGNLVTWAGSSWHCNERTTSKPGDGSKSWTLMVKRGRDGKDLRENMPAQALPVVSIGAAPVTDKKSDRDTEIERRRKEIDERRIDVDPDVESVRRSEAVKRAAPWEGQGRRD
jgi:hypothetical protein